MKNAIKIEECLLSSESKTHCDVSRFLSFSHFMKMTFDLNRYHNRLEILMLSHLLFFPLMKKKKQQTMVVVSYGSNLVTFFDYRGQKVPTSKYPLFFVCPFVVIKTITANLFLQKGVKFCTYTRSNNNEKRGKRLAQIQCLFPSSSLLHHRRLFCWLGTLHATTLFCLNCLPNIRVYIQILLFRQNWQKCEYKIKTYRPPKPAK